jgi:hypothetical protein
MVEVLIPLPASAEAGAVERGNSLDHIGGMAAIQPARNILGLLQTGGEKEKRPSRISCRLGRLSHLIEISLIAIPSETYSSSS